jgi:thiol-disulfide isomerase/thioredoxin
MAPSFSLPDLIKNRGDMSLRQLQGKVVLVDFWASWCPPCKKSLPELGHMHNRNPALVIVAISIDENRSKAVDFLKDSDTSLVYLHDAKHEAAENFDLGGMPSAFLIDKKGMLRNRFDGYGSGSGELKSMETEARKLLEEKP